MYGINVRTFLTIKTGVSVRSGVLKNVIRKWREQKSN